MLIKDAPGLNVVNIRLVKEATLYGEEAITDPDSAIRFMGKYLSGFDREVVCVLNLSITNRVLSMNVVSMGTIRHSLISARDIYKSAILSNAAGILLFHNHPSGKTKPSVEDLLITKQLIEAGELMDIELVDHIIVGGYTGTTYSFKGNQLMDKETLTDMVERQLAERRQPDRDI